QSNVELAAAAVRAAQARLAEANLNLGYTNVRAPISGLSSRAPKSEGSLVTANETLLTTISQVDPMWIPFPVAENQQLELNRAVKDSTQGKFVYVAAKDKDNKDIAAVRIITLGDWSIANGVNLWIVENGLKPGDMVITDGVSKLRAGAPIVLGAPLAPGAPPAP